MTIGISAVLNSAPAFVAGVGARADDSVLAGGQPPGLPSPNQHVEGHLGEGPSRVGGRLDGPPGGVECRAPDVGQGDARCRGSDPDDLVARGLPAGPIGLCVKERMDGVELLVTGDDGPKRGFPRSRRRRSGGC